jgi:hypothetical protein
MQRVLRGLFLAVLTAGEPFGMAHLIQGAKREYQKLGRPMTESDFARRYQDVRS